MQFEQRLAETEKRFEGLTQQLSDPILINDGDAYRKAAKARSDIEEVVSKYRDWKQYSDELAQANGMLAEADADLRAMAEDEVARLTPLIQKTEENLKFLLLPQDPLDAQ